MEMTEPIETDLFLQPIWNFCLQFQPTVNHFLFPAVLGLLSFFLTCCYFTYLDLIQYEPTKVQKGTFPTVAEMKKAAIPQMSIYIILNTISWFAFPYYDELPAEAPTVLEFFVHLLINFIVGDFLIYWNHRVMHMIPYLRKNIHSVHHEYTTVFSWAGGWVHPLEDATVIMCETICPKLFLNSHPLVFWVYVWLWVVCLIDEHSGHDVWWSLFRILPYSWGGGGAPHDIHHFNNTVKNYGFVLNIWDKMFGTFQEVVPWEDMPCNKAKAKKAQNQETNKTK